MIAVGDNIPNCNLKKIGSSGPEDVNTKEIFSGKKIVLFSVPGAFTPTCSAKHLPGYIVNYDKFIRKEIDEIICMAVNDPFVMKAWSKDQKSEKKVTLLADGNAEFSSALGLTFDGSAFGLGTRGQRFAMVIENRKVVYIAIEKKGAFEVSSAESILSIL